MLKIAIIGAGWVGQTMAAVLSNVGHTVMCADNNAEKISQLQAGKETFFEPGLSELLILGKHNNSLHFTTDVTGAMQLNDIVLCAVGTPSLTDGSADVSQVFNLAKTFGEVLDRPKVFVIKSTVPPGTCQQAITIIAEARSSKPPVAFTVASNPEFLSEGTAIRDAQQPERIVVGLSDPAFKETIDVLYQPFTARDVPLIYMSTASAELTKYAANAFLATKISFINEIANFCELVDADPLAIAKGIGLDSRIGPKFLKPGVGYGGSCFPKDVRALIHAGEVAGLGFSIISAAHQVNEQQRSRYYEKLLRLMDGSVAGKRIALLGLSYKTGTDDVRESPALYFIDRLAREGAQVVAYDPLANDVMRKIFPDIAYAESPELALQQSVAAVLLTEWPIFREVLHKVTIPIIDGRYFLTPNSQ